MALVRAVRDDDGGRERSSRDLYVRARKRRRRLGLAALGAGPMAGVASRIADLYCEAATFCDVVDIHELDLGDEQIAAHLLPQERVGGRGWGRMDIQATRGSLPLFRLGWSFDDRSTDPRHDVNAAANERERVLHAVQWWI